MVATDRSEVSNLCVACRDSKSWESVIGTPYQRCLACQHEIRIDPPVDSLIVNETLSPDLVKKIDSLDRYKINLVRQVARNDDFILDVGAASGKFLYAARHLFRDHLGIEVTESCIEFGRSVLGLSIEREIADLPESISVATFWHTLEHLPDFILESTLNKICEHANQDTRLIISVPNADSFAHRWFGTRFAFYDSDSHIHQFSARSLQTWLGRLGFSQEKACFSLPYSGFAWLQTLLNLFDPIHNYLYYRKKRGWTYDKSKLHLLVRDTLHLILCSVLAGPALALTILDMVSPRKAAALTLVFRKTTE